MKDAKYIYAHRDDDLQQMACFLSSVAVSKAKQ